MKTDEELIEVWKEYEKDTIKGINAFYSLSSNEKYRLFDLVAEGKHR
jgi:hypothetical protein